MATLKLCFQLSTSPCKRSLSLTGSTTTVLTKPKKSKEQKASCHCPAEVRSVINRMSQRRLGESFWDGCPVASLSTRLPSPLGTLKSERKEEEKGKLPWSGWLDSPLP